MSTTARVARGLPINRAVGYLMDKFPGRDRYPTYNQIIRMAYDGRFHTDIEGRTRNIRESDIARFEASCGFGLQADEHEVTETAA
jgi:hypothetical protein